MLQSVAAVFLALGVLSMISLVVFVVGRLGAAGDDLSAPPAPAPVKPGAAPTSTSKKRSRKPRAGSTTTSVDVQPPAAPAASNTHDEEEKEKCDSEAPRIRSPVAAAAASAVSSAGARSPGGDDRPLDRSFADLDLTQLVFDDSDGDVTATVDVNRAVAAVPFGAAEALFPTACSTVSAVSDKHTGEAAPWAFPPRAAPRGSFYQPTTSYMPLFSSLPTALWRSSSTTAAAATTATTAAAAAAAAASSVLPSEPSQLSVESRPFAPSSSVLPTTLVPTPTASFAAPPPPPSYVIAPSVANAPLGASTAGGVQPGAANYAKPSHATAHVTPSKENAGRAKDSGALVAWWWRCMLSFN